MFPKLGVCWINQEEDIFGNFDLSWLRTRHLGLLESHVIQMGK